MFNWVCHNVFRCLKRVDNLGAHYGHSSQFSKQLLAVLYLAAFLSYGLCDSMSAAYMMMIRGIGAELNPIMRYIAAEDGIVGFIIFKLWATVIILGTIYFVDAKSRNHMTWTVSGFLLSLTAGGVLATLANLYEASGRSFVLSSLDIIMLFTAFIAVSIILGDLLDKRYQKHASDKTGNANEQSL